MIDRSSAVPAPPELIRENLDSFAPVLREGRFKHQDYLSAVTYVSHKSMGLSNRDAYAETFPERYAALQDRGHSAKTISAHVAMYNGNRLVRLVHDRHRFRLWVLHHEAVQEAIGMLVEIMRTAKSDRVRVRAADSLLSYLCPPTAAA